MLDDIALFIHIVQKQGLAPTAKALDIPAATVTRRLQKLENTLRCQLIHRSARNFSLTPEGEVYFRAYSHLVDQFEQTKRQLHDDMHGMSGALKVMAPVNLTSGFMRPMWSDFIRNHPHIQLELSLSNQLEDYLASKADLAIRVGPQPDSNLYQKHLGVIKTLLVAAPRYLQQNNPPTMIDELNNHRLIGTKPIMNWELSSEATDQVITYHPSFSTLVNDVNLATQFACEGLGISLLPETEIRDLLNSGRLIHILPKWRGRNRDVIAVWHGGKLMNVRAKRLLDFIVNYMQQHKA
ncbi:LysR family transcriptional regulator [Neptunomonas concharum]|uniref:LysR family transcriptional regulator n=1 Tax=Neptunomonas concharum TaxID=1031538 RepID=A0A5P1RCZ9_9GAMM|nr:LysR family transcriptional regulator [Neptunomonas concharum]QEQ97539.1 LysR family transcriptional regulator [Neptunomonas concharum]